MAKIYNNRYKRVKELGQGSFANVYLCQDMLPSQPGRFLSEEVLFLIAAIQDESPEVEFVSGYAFDGEKTDNPERMEALSRLADLKTLLPANA
jgi:serine/threonine protein kinase